MVRDIVLSTPDSQAYPDDTFEHMMEQIDRYHPDLLLADIGYPSKGRQQALFDYYFEQVPEGTVNDRWGPVDILGDIAQITGAMWVLKALGRLLVFVESNSLKDHPARFGFKTAEYDSLPGTPAFKWESTRGLGGSFAFNAAETAIDMLTAAKLADYLVDTVAKNGNVLINVGPDSFMATFLTSSKLHSLSLVTGCTSMVKAIYATRP